MRFISGPKGYPVAWAFPGMTLCGSEDEARKLLVTGATLVDGRQVRHDQWLRPGKTYRLGVGPLVASFELGSNRHDCALAYVEAAE